MKRLNTLKGVRVLLALLLFIPILLFFVDFSGSLPSAIHHLLEAQVMPAVMWTMWGILLFHLLFTLVFGRLYCSTLCPAGVLQDIINNLLCRVSKKEKRDISFFLPQAIECASLFHLGINRHQCFCRSFESVSALRPV